MPSDFQNLNGDASATTRKPRRTAAFRPRLGSLAISLAIPVTLTTAIILQFGAGRRYQKLLETPFCLLPPIWLIHGCSVAAATLMGLASWMVWSHGGFNLESLALPLYVAQVSLAIVWDPLVLVIGSAPVGFGFCVLNFVTVVACWWSFWKVDPLAAKIVQVCAIWAAFLTVVTLKLCFLPL